MAQNANPLNVYCKNCGAPAGFDIVHQEYRCTHCDTSLPLAQARGDHARWQAPRPEDAEELARSVAHEERACPSCGAHVLFDHADASMTCVFCGSKLVRKQLLDASQLPALMIPFYLTPEEARERLAAWAQTNRSSREGRATAEHVDDLVGYYLPYQLVRGPVQGTVIRNGTARTYRCRGYVEESLVNVSTQLDNEVLHNVEPFDWSAVRTFDVHGVAGHNVKLRDMEANQAARRVCDETSRTFLPSIERVLHTTGIDVKLETEALESIPVLLPVYVARCGDLTAAVNGQTGRVAVTVERKRTLPLWVLEPLLYAVLATALLGLPYGFDPESCALFFAVFCVLFLAIMGNGKRSLIRRIIRRGNESALRTDQGLQVAEFESVLRNACDNTPVFVEPNAHGELVPVEVSFYSPARWASIVLNVFLLVLAPLIVAGFIACGMTLATGEAFAEHFNPLYGMAWYVLAGLLGVVYWVRGVRGDVYEHPILHELLPNGGKQLMGTKASRRVGVLSMLRLGHPGANGKPANLRSVLGELGGIGAFALFTVAAIFVGSVVAILA